MSTDECQKQARLLAALEVALLRLRRKKETNTDPSRERKINNKIHKLETEVSNLRQALAKG